MKEHSFTYRNSVISFKQAGIGKKLLFCFHGFGEDGYSFANFEKFLGATYTLIAPDLPFHGKTKWEEGLGMDPDDLVNIIFLIAEQFGLDKESNERFSVFAYSMGGRIAFYLLQSIPSKIEKMVLAAPDGLKMNFWYWLATQTWLGNRLFEFTMHKPYWFFNVVKAGYKTGLVNKSVAKFVHHYIDDKNARIHLYRRWTTMRKFTPDLAKIKQVIKEQRIRLTLIFGSYDRIIFSKRSDFLVNGNTNINVKVIQAGHQLLRDKYVKEIAAVFSE